MFDLLTTIFSMQFYEEKMLMVTCTTAENALHKTYDSLILFTLIGIRFLPLLRIKKRAEIISGMIITQMEVNPARCFLQIPVSWPDDSITD